MRDDDDLPEEYIPTALRKTSKHKRVEVRYACGYDEGEGSGPYAMRHGPFPTLEEALEIVPEEEARRSVIIHFNLNGSDDVLYVWHKYKRCWRKN